MPTYLDRVVSNTAIVQDLIKHIGILEDVGLRAALIELAINKSNQGISTNSTVEVAAMRHYWMQGYMEAVKDMFDFVDQYCTKHSTPPKPCFGSVK